MVLVHHMEIFGWFLVEVVVDSQLGGRCCFFFCGEGNRFIGFWFIIITDSSWILMDVCVLGFEVFSVGFLKNLQGKPLNKTG